MAGPSNIEWTQKTWNPVAGCSVLSPGCTNCYAMKMAARIEAMARGLGRASAYDGLTRPTRAGPVWTGELRLVDSALTQPLRWKKPALIFVNSMSDLFHEAVPDATIDQVFAIMALSPQHTFQLLTKRAERMRAYCSDPATPGRIARAVAETIIANRLKRTAWPVRPNSHSEVVVDWPLPNVWLGVSAEDQTRADERIPHLLATPAAVRFLSAEPLLGAIDLTALELPGGHSVLDSLNRASPADYWASDWSPEATGVPLDEAIEGFEDWGFSYPPSEVKCPGLDWVIVGGESGPGARPMHPDCPRQIRDACAAAGVPFFFKQWGMWAPGENAGPVKGPQQGAYLYDSGWSYTAFTRAAAEDLTADDEPDVWRVGKRAAGRLLDGVEHNAMPGGVA